MDIYAPLALVAGLGEQGPPVRPLGLSGQLQMGARVAQEFVGFAWLRLPTGGVWQGHQQTSH